MYDCAFHLGLQIRCTKGSPILDTLDHLPPLPLFVSYKDRSLRLTVQDELGLYHALRLHDRVRHIELVLRPSILHKVLLLMDKQFPTLEHLSLSFEDELDFSNKKKPNITPRLTLPLAFRAPNLRHLALFSIDPSKRLRVLTSTVSLVTLELRNIQTSSYSRPRLLVARLRSLPHLEELYISFSVPIPRPSTERELLGERRTPVTLPSLKNLQFIGVSTYLESFVAQISAPGLKELRITLFNQISFTLPHLIRLIDITEGLKLPIAAVGFDRNGVHISTVHHGSAESGWLPFFIRVNCNQLDWQIDCAAQICHALIPALSCAEQLTLYHNYQEMTAELRNGEIESLTWQDLLRSFIGVQRLYIEPELSEELSRALQADEVGLDSGFLPNLRSIHAEGNLFASFIDTRQGVGLPVQFVEW